MKNTKGVWVFQGCAAVDGKKKGTKHASTNSPTAWEILERKGIMRELFLIFANLAKTEDVPEVAEQNDRSKEPKIKHEMIPPKKSPSALLTW